MMWISVELLKQHSRIDIDDEDGLLALYVDAAEEVVLEYTRRSYEELVELGGGSVPQSVVNATLLIANSLYTHRSPAEPGVLSMVPYTADMLLKPWMKLSD